MITDPQIPPSIVVVDDEPDVLALYKRILEPEGFTVITSLDGESGLRQIRETNPNLILLDIMMPGADGFAVLEKIRQFSNAPVIMVTAKRDIESLRKTLTAGADDYINKPFRSAELVARVKAKLRRS